MTDNTFITYLLRECHVEQTSQMCYHLTSGNKSRQFLINWHYSSRPTDSVCVAGVLGYAGAVLRWGSGSTCPQIHLLPHIQKLTDHSDVISEVQKCYKIQKRWGSLQRSQTLNWWGGARCPLPRTPPPLSALRASFLRVSGSNPLQSSQPY